MSSDATHFEDDGWPAPFHAAVPGVKAPHPDGSHPGRGFELNPNDITNPDEATIVPVDTESIATEWITADVHDLVNYESLETTRVEPYEQDDSPTLFAFTRNNGRHVEFTEEGSPNGSGILARTADTVEVKQ